MPVLVEVKARKVRRGLYRLDGVTHAAARAYGDPAASFCGGQVYAERFGPQRDGEEILPGSWECFCERCLDCDADGWDTLRECLEAAPGYWLGAALAEEGGAGCW